MGLRFVSRAFYVRQARIGNGPRALLIVAQIIILKRAAPVCCDLHCLISVSVDLVIAQDGAAACLNCYPRSGIGKDVVVLQEALPLLIDVDATLFAIMDVTVQS